MLTVVTSLRSQNRNVLEFMTEVIAAARSGQSAPSLLSETAVYRGTVMWSHLITNVKNCIYT